jgi:hypothetical protein
VNGLRNGYWSIDAAPGRARLEGLGFDAQGLSQWCPSLLKTGSPAKPRHPIATVCGAQSGYFDDAGSLWTSESAPQCPWTGGADRLEAGPFEFGSVRETWSLALDGPRLAWTIRREWLADTRVADSFAPGLFFAAHAVWGTATVFQLWDRDTAGDGYYSLEPAFGGGATTAATRTVRAGPGGWSVAKLLSRAGPNGDLRVTTSHHLKKGEVLNCMSLLAQGGSCEPATGMRSMHRGEVELYQFGLEPEPRETGFRLAVDLSGPLGAQGALNRRFYDTHANCAILADTHDWRFGNEPSGYVAKFCSFMYSQMAGLGFPALPTSPDGMDPALVLAEQMGVTARNLVEKGTAGDGYQNDTSLDILPSFLCSFRDLALRTGDRDWVRRHWAGARRAAGIIASQVREGGGMISTRRDNGNDYWDWISRNGRIGLVNVLAALGLRAQAAVARWLGDLEAEREAAEPAGRIVDAYNRDFWDEERGHYADWIDLQGQAHHFLYAGPQLQAISAGLVPPERARRVVGAILARRRELGPAWEACFSLQTNFHDAEAYSMMFREHKSDVTRFGQTMNGGCLVSWNYYWIAALAMTGLAEEARGAWQSVLGRFAETSLVEGCNYWDFSGKPSRTAWHDYDHISYEPFLSDQGLVSLALPRWLLGIEPSFDGITVNPVLPPDAYPARVKLVHLGRERVIDIPDASPRTLPA